MLSKPMQPNSKSSDREWMRRSANAVKARKIGRRGRKPHEPSMRRTTSLRFREASTGSLSYFLGCLVPYHGGPTECIYLFLPPCHRPSPREVWVGFPLRSANTTSRGGCFRGCRHFFMFRPPSLLVSQVVPTAAQRAAGQPRLLHPGRTCFVASARTGYASRPNTGN